MLQQIIENYENFGDALITAFHYDSGYHKSNTKEPSVQLEIFISCFHLRSGNNDKIKITCKDVQYFKTNGIDRMVFGALMLKMDGVITLDFFPVIVSRDELNEDPNSDFIVKCREVFYESLIDAGC